LGEFLRTPNTILDISNSYSTIKVFSALLIAVIIIANPTIRNPAPGDNFTFYRPLIHPPSVTPSA
jgi:hypothetical protein